MEEPPLVIISNNNNNHTRSPSQAPAVPVVMPARPSATSSSVVSILPPARATTTTTTAATKSNSSSSGEPGLNKASLSNPLTSLQSILVSQVPNSKGLGQLVTFAASTPIASKDHGTLFHEVQRVLQREAEMRRDLIEFEEVMNLNPHAVYYGRKPSAVFPELDNEFPSHEYDEILFMRQFVSFMITRLQIVCGLCPPKSKELEMVNSIVRSWWQRSMDYM